LGCAGLSFLLAQGTGSAWPMAFSYISRDQVCSQPAEPGCSSQWEVWVLTIQLFLTITIDDDLSLPQFLLAGLSAAEGDYLPAFALIMGVFCGSSLWWLLLSSGANLFRDHLSVGNLVWVNRISGLIISGFGSIALLSSRIFE
jgi:arginine exporter protein ArgO